MAERGGHPAVTEGNVRRIAVLTSGGDAPGMNAAIPAVVRPGIEVVVANRKPLDPQLLVLARILAK
jgi:hypothetical protein